ncbi:hypothetical protein [Nocardioides nanhaiensis]|uniref:Lipoprotein n=1 Tax=Nocardioides nanhaiensis TaxID=1476871 RepID=A0ABP8WXT1_9ACTN
MKPAARRRLATVATLAVVTLVGGCSDEPEPRFAEPSESVTSSDAPTTADSNVPARAGESEFIENYFALMSTSFATGDPQSWLDQSGNSCQNCRTIADNVRAAYADGGRVEGAEYVVENATFIENSPIGAVWRVDIRSAQQRWLDSSGAVTKIVEAGELTYEIAVQRDAQAGLVAEGLRIP